MLEFVNSILSWAEADDDWQPISRWAIATWLAFYVFFLLYAFHMHGGFLFIDSANLVVHEGGHLLFGWFGKSLGLWGGTILQWLVPLLLAAYFFHQRQSAAFAFCLFFFFENWLYTPTYMADARHGLAPCDHGRLRLCRTRLEYNFLQPRRSAVRHDHCGHREGDWLVRDAGVCRLARSASENNKAVSGATGVPRPSTAISTLNCSFLPGLLGMPFTEIRTVRPMRVMGDLSTATDCSARMPSS
jgi:hypothetical protein